MNDEAKIGAMISLTIFAFLVLLICLMFWFSSSKCHAQWDGSQFEVRWGPMESCMIKVNGQWIPAANYREIK